MPQTIPAELVTMIMKKRMRDEAQAERLALKSRYDELKAKRHGRARRKREAARARAKE